MGIMSFLLPADLEPETIRELERACISGGPDSMPWPTQVKVQPGLLTARRAVDESGSLVVPWSIDGAGRLLSTTATLIEREQPYQFLVELARGKVHQLRTQSAEWQAGGLQMPADLTQKIREASVGFSRAVTKPPSEEAGREAQDVLTQGYRAAEHLVLEYIEQMFQARHLRQPRLDTTQGCLLGPIELTSEHKDILLQTCNSVCLDLSWKAVEPTEANYRWDAYDACLDWAAEQGLTVTAGPLIDFSSNHLPEWLWLWERDLASIATFMADYVQTAVKRYQGRIRTWQLTGASNCATLLGLGEDELLWLTVRMAEAARQIDPKIEMIVGIAQPWGEYMAGQDRSHSPFIFADTLLRSGLSLAGLDLELIMGIESRGSYCRDLINVSRMIDLYTILGVPLRITMGYPSASGPDAKADKDMKVSAGSWREGFSPEAQAQWAAAFVALALCKPSVRSVQWAQLTDAHAHVFPHCGLFDGQNQPKPVVQSLRDLREKHLR
jgi:hypothetical protein